MSILFLLYSGIAHGFCGTFVGAPGAQLANKTSQVVYARDGRTTTLTLVADYAGDLSEFALVLPVPPDLDPGRVRVVDPGVVDRLDRYSTPRLVDYTCRDAITYTHEPYSTGAGCAMVVGCGADSDALIDGLPVEVEYIGAGGAVTVEAEFQVAEYDVVVLSASGAGGLQAWLSDNGYALPAGGDDILNDYIEGGASFLAAKVRLDEVPQGTSRLSPLQIAYDTDVLGLPVRIGTISAVDEQEVLIYALTDADQFGQMEIRNYPEVRLEDECMWPGEDHTSFTEFYKEALVEAAEEAGGATWTVEYSWILYYESEVGGPHCDPCTVEVEELYDRGELADLGFVNGSAQLTRIRMSYGPDEVPEDLVLATRESQVNSQIRYIDYDRQLEFLFPICGQGYLEEPGQCGDDGTHDVKLGGSRSMLPPALAVVFGTLMLAGLRRRE